MNEILMEALLTEISMAVAKMSKAKNLDEKVKLSEISRNFASTFQLLAQGMSTLSDLNDDFDDFDEFDDDEFDDDVDDDEIPFLK